MTTTPSVATSLPSSQSAMFARLRQFDTLAQRFSPFVSWLLIAFVVATQRAQCHKALECGGEAGQKVAESITESACSVLMAWGILVFILCVLGYKGAAWLVTLAPVAVPVIAAAACLMCI